MINVYYQGGKNRTKVFFNVMNNKVSSIVVGNRSVSHESGFQFYVDEHVAEQLHKCEFYIDGITPKLSLKKGEILDVPTEKELKRKEIEELESRLKQLKAE